MSEITLSVTNFEKEVLESDKPVLVDFWAGWCGPCMMLAPTISEIAESHKDTIKVGKVNVDECPGIAGLFGIESIPTVLLFKNGKVVDRSVGYKPREAIVSMLK